MVNTYEIGIFRLCYIPPNLMYSSQLKFIICYLVKTQKYNLLQTYFISGLNHLNILAACKCKKKTADNVENFP